MVEPPTVSVAARLLGSPVRADSSSQIFVASEEAPALDDGVGLVAMGFCGIRFCAKQVAFGSALVLRGLVEVPSSRAFEVRV